MRDVPASILAGWASPVTIGDDRPMVRLTVQKPMMQIHNTVNNTFASYLFGVEQGTPMELPNVLAVNWSRSIDSEVGTATMELLNVAPLPIGQAAATGDFDLLGHYTPQHGLTEYSSRWGHTANAWSKMLVPDNIIRVYEGYGFDESVPPSSDPHLVQTGVWVIDAVQLTHDGRITIECRDTAGKLLQEQIAFPPVVPFSAGPVAKAYPKGKYAYPVSFESVNPDPVIIAGTTTTHVNVDEVPLKFDDTSNTPYIGSKNATYRGHRGSEAFDGDAGTYWLSVGNARPDQGYSYEWVQGSCGATKVNEVRFRTKGTGYTAYIGIYANGAWQTSAKGGKVPYDPNHPASAPNGSDKNYVISVPVRTEGWVEVDLPKGYTNVTKVRVTFGNLWDSNLGPYQYRAGVRELAAYTASTTTTRTAGSVTTFDLKNYNDYTDIVKLFLAWAGYFWPAGAYELDTAGTQLARTYTQTDKSMPINGAGRVWGDFKLSGTAGPETLGVELFDKKPILDCIKYIADVLGYVFYIDETGGAVFRPPNIYGLGNLRRTLSRASGVRTSVMPKIDEVVALKSLAATLDGTNLRERTFVSNTDGSLGAMVQGWIPNPTGLRRVGGWSDQNFKTQGEVKIMAEMIALRQLFSYRSDSVVIKGNPQIQVDDQVRIYERVTNEGYVHYVRSIEAGIDLRSGVYDYQLTTNWLGERPFEKWVFDPARLSREARRYLQGLYGSGEERV